MPSHERLAERQAVTRLQRPSVETAERAHRVRGARAEKQRDVEAAVDCEEAAETGAGRQAHRDLGPLGDPMALPRRKAFAVHGDLRLGTADRHGRVAFETKAKVAERDLEPGGRRRVADEQVGRPQREVIHRPGREEPLSLHSPAAGIVLDGRLDAALENLDRSHGTGVAAAAASRRWRRSSTSPSIVGSHSRYSARSNGLSSVR